MKNRIIKVNIPQDYKNMWVNNMKIFRDIINSKNITAEIESDDIYIFHIDKLNIANKLYESTQTLNEDTILLHLISVLMDLIQGYHFMTICCTCIEEFADEFGFIYDDDMTEEEKQEVEKAYEHALEQTKIIPQVFTKEELDKLYDCFFEISE